MTPSRTMAVSATSTPSGPAIDYANRLSRLSKGRKPSPIRALQPLVKLPGMISLGGGMPNPGTFPYTGVAITVRGMPTPLNLTADELETALQYSATPGCVRGNGSEIAGTSGYLYADLNPILMGQPKPSFVWVERGAGVWY